MQNALAKIQKTLMQPEVKKAGKEQIKEKARESIREKLAKGRPVSYTHLDVYKRQIHDGELVNRHQGYAILVREEFSCLEFIMNRDTIMNVVFTAAIFIFKDKNASYSL